MAILDQFLWIGLPYAALVLFPAGGIYRYRRRGFSYSSLSSQFLEGGGLFWGSLPFHWGLAFLFFGHLAAFLFPETLLAFNNHPVRLLIIEISAFASGVLVLFGLLALFIRRVGRPRIRVVTSRMDLVIEVLLIVQVVLGLLTALTARWGSSWFAASLTPYLRSLFILQPDISVVATLPLLVKLHLIGAFLLAALIPFSRLVHLLVLPLHCTWRPLQRVIWNWNPKELRRPGTPWTIHEPRNN